MTTVASQVAIALDNASAYQQIEEWNAGLELKIQERTQALEQADRLRSQFLSHVSHELRTPLTSIKGFVQNLLDGLTGPLNEKQQRYLFRMLDNSDRLIRMIEDLLDRTSIEAGRLEVHPVDLDLESCLTDAATSSSGCDQTPAAGSQRSGLRRRGVGRPGPINSGGGQSHQILLEFMDKWILLRVIFTGIR